MLGPIISLSGDSAQADAIIPEPFQHRLAPHFAGWIGQCDLLRRSGESRLEPGIDRRLALLDRIIPDDGSARGVVLIGRSSGARVASLFAMRRPVAAIVCLAYPFRAPSKVIEPERFTHLARLTVPTLLLQPRDDVYGGWRCTEDYALSDAVRVELTEGDHRFALQPAEFDRVARLILQFCADVETGQRPGFAPFDEAFYLDLYPDVANAVTAGRFDSGWTHYDRTGRAEGRRARFLPR